MELKSAREVVNVLGGAAAVARLAKVNIRSASRWQAKDGRFPAKTYPLLMAELEQLGHSAPASLWSIIPRRSS